MVTRSVITSPTIHRIVYCVGSYILTGHIGSLLPKNRELAKRVTVWFNVAVAKRVGPIVLYTSLSRKECCGGDDKSGS